MKTWPSIILLLLLWGCNNTQEVKQGTDISALATDEGTSEYLKQFPGRGALTDDSKLPSPQKSLSEFQVAPDLQLDLVLSEPEVNQPVEVNFDHRGRMWVVQYTQYPYPKGLNVTSTDHHMRFTYDKKPTPPPSGEKGADKITLYEDKDGDGTYETITDAITGLNIATSVTWGRGKIWVLNPPFLLAYPDPDGDGLPDGDPEVHVDGFGLEDTHAAANSLRWGPDGWLYGAQGSTNTAVINTAVTKDLAFEGQVIWRYHPVTQEFEIYAEGGGNTFHVEIDSKGRIYSGTNGYGRGQYYKQGAYYGRNFGKHGALTNPYSFGNLEDMALEGEKIRFTHAWIKYEGGTLPDTYNGQMFAINPLHNYVQLTRLEPSGSTFATIDEDIVMSTEDRWFRPVDIKAGPDGGIYIADWCDSRLSHVDPKDTWHRKSGRIYRLSSKNPSPTDVGDLSKLTSEELCKLLSHPNKWYRQQALRQFGDRKDQGIIPTLKQMMDRSDGQTALEALWALHLSGGWNDTVAMKSMQHIDPFVRMWAVRLIGDHHKTSDEVAAKLIEMAGNERHPEVQSQLAATAKRLDGSVGIPIIEKLSALIDPEDPDNPLLLWWGMEGLVDGNQKLIGKTFEDPALWARPVIKDVILDRLMRRLLMQEDADDYALATTLLKEAPSPEYGQILMTGLLKGLRGKEISTLPRALTSAMEAYQGQDVAPLALGLRQKDPEVVSKAMAIVRDSKKPFAERIAYIKIMGEVDLPGSVSALIDIIQDRSADPTMIKEALFAASNYAGDSIAETILRNYPDVLRSSMDVRVAALYVLSSRESWAKAMLERVTVQRQIHATDVPIQILRQLALLDNEEIDQTISKWWPESAGATPEAKAEEIARIKGLVGVGKGDPAMGKRLFEIFCGTCHQLHGQGGSIGPDLTGYDRSDPTYLSMQVVDPHLDIREGYVTFGLFLKDGRVLTGIVKNKSTQEITILPSGGEEITLSMNEVERIEAQPFSLMQEGITTNLSDQQVTDLFAYIMNQGPI